MGEVNRGQVVRCRGDWEGEGGTKKGEGAEVEIGERGEKEGESKR